MLPSWLAEHLESNTRGFDAGTHLTPRARIRRCPGGCGRYVLAALDDVLIEPTYCDPVPITPAGELYALLSGRRTYSLIFDELLTRDSHRIAWADADAEPVLAAHRCTEPAIPPNPRHRRPQPIRYIPGDKPPF